jgi:phenylpropionate dioxygenase-like ring-hydroxylating dioxygenase large terminal subunit
MTLEAAQQTSTLPIPEVEQTFNWRQCWYPVTFLKDLPPHRPYSFSLYDEPLVLFRNKQEKLVCLIDRCPHRAAKLSDGQIIDGKLECLYHGWQFGSEGQCLHIPQLPTDAKIPMNACVQAFTVVERQGMIWVWPGKPETADEELIPVVDILNAPEVISIDYMADLPYDQTYLVENFLDPAHVYISHDRTEAGVYREDAQPLEMEAIETSIAGIRGRYRGTRKPNESWKQLDFMAPNLVHYRLGIEERGLLFGLHCIQYL